MTPAESASLAARFAKAKTPEDFAKLDQSLDRLYNNGVLSPTEFSRLTVKLMTEQTKHLP
jgi:hypothetical protein